MDKAVKKNLPAYEIKNEDGVYHLYRDGEAMKTPRGLALATAKEKLAEAMLQECLGQGDERLDLRQMPMTQMALTVIDIAALQRDNIIDGIMRYADSELICQRAAEPEALIAEQHRVWQPYIDWCQSRFDITLKLGSGIAPFTQVPETLATLRAFIESYDDYQLVGISEAIGVSGSLVLGLALVMGHADPKAILAAAELDQLWQMQKWGQDPAVASRHAAILRDLTDCVRWFSLVG